MANEAQRARWQRLWVQPCVTCGKKPANGIDHIIAKADGGLHVTENLQPMCWDCNRAKEAQRQMVAFQGRGNPRVSVLR